MNEVYCSCTSLAREIVIIKTLMNEYILSLYIEMFISEEGIEAQLI